jgi:(1->4)-alpha-D-glucan 1-alpha-D-glucosylmutase
MTDAVDRNVTGAVSCNAAGRDGGEGNPTKTIFFIPTSTYRVQLSAGFTFADATGLLDYLQELGVGALYVSPILAAREGSGHGYDIVDYGAINPELGGREGLERLAASLRAAGMGLVVDVVPNHMCIADERNSRWWDVLENGPGSPQARFFDIDWRPPREDLAYKALLPILGDQYGVILESQQLRVTYEDGAFVVHHWEKRFPTAPRSWLSILELVLLELRRGHREDEPAVMEMESITTALRYLPLRTETEPERLRERQREKAVIRSRLSALISGSESCAGALNRVLQVVNGSIGDPTSFDILERFLSDQAYRLSFWRVAADEINYRRFFDINELAAIRVEDPVVFSAVHEKVLECVAAGWVTGLRVDHPDGLSDPVRYFQDLQQACRRAAGAECGDERPFYIVAEKIMVGDERPRRTWAVHGTTGYGFLNELNSLFVDPSAEAPLTRIYEKFTGNNVPFADLIYQSKRLILRVSMSSELNVLARRLDRICQQHRHTRDFTLDSLRFALREVISCFPVYRTYIRSEQTQVDSEDHRHIELAIEEAKRRNTAVSDSIFDAIASILRLEDPPGISEEQRSERRLFVMRFQQLTGPVMAKGVEDTAFYRRYPLASLNEVGGDPALFGITVEDFHRRVAERRRHWPHNMLASSTHDTKRSEDVRARLNVLSEIPDDWGAAVMRWHQQNLPLHKNVNGVDVPDRNAEYLLYLTLIGTWPLQAPSSAEAGSGYVARMKQYMIKALREAKVHTSWINPDAEYDAAVSHFVEAVLDEMSGSAFRRDLGAFVESIRRAGLMNSLAQLVLKSIGPGVPDFYQGNEIWDFSLVDPDNRRLVDFGQRRELLRRLESAEGPNQIAELMENAEDGRLKLFVTQRLLRFRRDHAAFFQRAEYLPLTAFGDQRDNVISFARTTPEQIVIAIAGRFLMRLGCPQNLPVGEEVWQDSAVVLPHDDESLQFRDVLSGRIVQPSTYRGRSLLPLSEIFADLPVAVLTARIA